MVSKGCIRELDYVYITITYLYNFYPLKPHFYTVKQGFRWVYIIFLISAQKHRLWVFTRTASPRRFKRVPTIYILSRNMKKISEFLSENFQFWVVKFSIYLNRRVFVMIMSVSSWSKLKTSDPRSKMSFLPKWLYLSQWEKNLQLW